MLIISQKVKFASIKYFLYNTILKKESVLRNLTHIEEYESLIDHIEMINQVLEIIERFGRYENLLKGKKLRDELF